MLLCFTCLSYYKRRTKMGHHNEQERKSGTKVQNSRGHDVTTITAQELKMSNEEKLLLINDEIRDLHNFCVKQGTLTLPSHA